MTWWKAIEEHVAEREQDAPDPWGDRPLADPALTQAQEAFLAAFDDQRRGRVVDDGAPAAGERVPSAEQDPEETGNSPGDEGVPPGVPSPS
jgi:hypothetical protein